MIAKIMQPFVPGERQSPSELPRQMDRYQLFAPRLSNVCHVWFPGILVFWAVLFASTPGCDQWHQEPATPGFMPSWEEARKSLVSALTAWRDAPSPLPATFNTRSIQFVDKHRQPNQRLLSFEILGQSDIENARQFTVRLNLEAEESPQLVKYNVVGRDPVWVFGLEDYEMFSHWEHDMGEPAPTTIEKPKEGPATESKKESRS